MSTHFVKKIKTNNENIVYVNNSDETVKSILLADDHYHRVPNNLRVLNPKYILTFANLPVNSRQNLRHPSWFSVQGADLVPIIDIAKNSAASSMADGVELIDTMISTWDSYVDRGPQPWSIFGEDASAIQMLMTLTAKDIAQLPWNQSEVWFSYRTEGKNDYAIRLVGESLWETTIIPSLTQNVSLSSYPFYSATAGMLTSNAINVVHVYYLALVNIRLEDDMYTELIPWEESDEFIRAFYQDYEFFNGDMINTDQDLNIELVGSWPNNGSFGKQYGLQWSSTSQTAKLEIWSEEKQEWTSSARIYGNGKWRFSDSNATPDQPTKINITTWACLYKDTLITMADGSLKPIIEIKPGDKVLTPFGEEIVDAVKGDLCEPFPAYTEYFMNNTSLKVINDHRILYNGRYVHISKLPGLARAIHVEECLPYSIYTNKSNTYYANGIVCGTFFSNSKFRMKILYPIYRRFFLKPAKIGPIRRWILKKLINGGSHYE